MSEAPEPEPTDPDAAGAAPRPLAPRGRVFKALALAPEAPLATWLDGLDAALARSPTLLDGRAIVLDVAALGREAEDLRAVLAALADRRIRVLGLEGADRPARWEPGLPPFLIGGRPAPDLDAEIGARSGAEAGAETDPAAEPRKPALSSITIEGSVRSGQTVVNLVGDVTVTGSVSSGAEILAGGNIHVYGALRGRAIAGAARNPRARIYCRRFEPELLGIDRLVRTAEEVGTGLRGKPAQVWLDGGAMRTAILD